MNCFKCDKELEEFAYLHPSGGVHFYTYGHYGSTVFDPVNGDSMHIYICDECLDKYKDRTTIVPYHPEHLLPGD